MWIKYLELKHFRNHTLKKFKFYDKKNVISGRNGAGKTSIIEAIYYLSTTKSFRSLDFSMTEYGEDFFSISCLANKKGMDEKLEIIYSSRNRKKQFKKDGIKIKRLEDVIGIINSILFYQNDLLLIDGSPDFKRDFLNRLFSQIDREYYSDLIKYNKIIESRNFVLKQPDEKQKYNNLEVLNKPTIEYGTKIILKRKQYIKEIESNFFKTLKNLNIKNLDGIGIDYISNIIDDENDFTPEKLKDEYNSKLKNSLNKETALGYTMLGPHRDNIIFKMNGKYDLSEIFSIGEKRITVTALKLSEFNFLKDKINDVPVILMDDILVELDNENRYIIIDFIKSIDAQFFLVAVDDKEYKEMNDKEVIILDG